MIMDKDEIPSKRTEFWISKTQNIYFIPIINLFFWFIISSPEEVWYTGICISPSNTSDEWINDTPGEIKIGTSPVDKNIDTPPTLEEIEKQGIYLSLERNKWKKMATCRELGISKDTLRRKIKNYALENPLDKQLNSVWTQAFSF